MKIIESHEAHQGNAIVSLCWSLDSNKIYSGCSAGEVYEFSCFQNIQKSGLFSFMPSFTKKTKLMCKCPKAIHDISSSVVTTETGLELDLIIVNTGSHSFIFQVPRDSKLEVVWREVSNHPTGTFFLSLPLPHSLIL